MSSAPSASERRRSPAAATAVIVEDEPELAAELRELLAAAWPELEIVGEAREGLAALRMIGDARPDVVFLDIRIPGPSGLDVARHVAGRSHVVFVTAYDAHAVDAFERGAVDYLLKPLSAARLFLTVERLKQKLGSEPAAAFDRDAPGSAASVRHLRWITASVGRAMRMILVDEVVFFQSDYKYTRVALADAEVLIRKPLKELLAELDPEQFWQIHRSTIVNALAIATVEPDLGGRLVVKLKTRREQLAVSESFMRRFRQM